MLRAFRAKLEKLPDDRVVWLLSEPDDGFCAQPLRRVTLWGVESNMLELTCISLHVKDEVSDEDEDEEELCRARDGDAAVRAGDLKVALACAQERAANTQIDVSAEWTSGYDSITDVALYTHRPGEDGASFDDYISEDVVVIYMSWHARAHCFLGWAATY